MIITLNQKVRLNLIGATLTCQEPRASIYLLAICQDHWKIRGAMSRLRVIVSEKYLKKAALAEWLMKEMWEFYRLMGDKNFASASTLGL